MRDLICCRSVLIQFLSNKICKGYIIIMLMQLSIEDSPVSLYALLMLKKHLLISTFSLCLCAETAFW